jgi:dienelactone hydrolase
MKRLLVCLGLAGALACAHATQVVSIPVAPAAGATGTEIRLEAFVYQPAGDGPHPVVIFSHGSSGGRPKASFRARRQADYFASRGFVVVVPMRRGRGGSTGVSLESEVKNCDIMSWAPGLQSSFEDLTGVLKYVQALKGADASKVLLAGTSRGGFLSVAYAASGEKRSILVGVVSFAGGWVAQAEDNCPTDFNHISFAEFGGRTSVPSLWLYGENDTFYSSESIRGYAEAFRATSDLLRFQVVAEVPENGHWLADHPVLWAPIVDSYLQSIGLGPSSRSALARVR